MVSSGAVILTFLGWLLLLMHRFVRVRYAIAIIAIVPITYPLIRIAFPGAITVNVSEESISGGSGIEERQRSMAFRVRNEELLLERWKLRPMLGWTGWHYHKTATEAVPDSLWILSLAKHGLLGWGLTTVTLLLPAVELFSERGEFIGGERHCVHCNCSSCVDVCSRLSC